MLTLLIHAAPLSEKCKSSNKLENGVPPTLPSVQSLTLNESIATVSLAPSSQAEISKILTMERTSTTALPSSIFGEDRRTLTLQNTAYTISVDGRAHTISSTGDSIVPYSSQDFCDTLKWCEARRIGSEPLGLQSWPSDGSLETSRYLEDDDVFTDRRVCDEDEDIWAVRPEEGSSGKKIIVLSAFDGYSQLYLHYTVYFQHCIFL